MADILVRNIPNEVVKYYKALAIQHNRSFDEEITETVVREITRWYENLFPNERSKNDG